MSQLDQLLAKVKIQINLEKMLSLQNNNNKLGAQIIIVVVIIIKQSLKKMSIHPKELKNQFRSPLQKVISNQ